MPADAEALVVRVLEGIVRGDADDLPLDTPSFAALSAALRDAYGRPVRHDPRRTRGDTVSFECTFERGAVDIGITSEPRVYIDAPVLHEPVEVTPVERTALIARADSIVETALTALNQRNYAAFTHQFGADMRARFTPEIFERTSARVVDKWGRYLGRELAEVTTTVLIATVTYDAAFERKTRVVVRLTFDRYGDRLVEGLWISPMKPHQRRLLRRRSAP